MGLFNRKKNNEKKSEEQKIKEIVGGTLMSNYFKERLEAHGIKAVGLNSKGTDLQRAFKRKIKEENIPADNLESELENFLISYNDNPDEIMEKGLVDYYSHNKNLLKKHGITGILDQGDFIDFFEKTKNKKINDNLIIEEDIIEYQKDRDIRQYELNKKKSNRKHNNELLSQHKDIKRWEFADYLSNVKNLDYYTDKITEEHIQEFHQWKQNEKIKAEEEEERYNQHLIDFEEQIKSLTLEELKQLKKETADKNEKNIIESRMRIQESIERLPVSEDEIEYMQEITLRETRTNHILSDRDEELIKGTIALTKDRVILHKRSYTRGKDRGLKKILYKNITSVDYDKGSRFGSDAIEITISGAEVLIIQSYSCEDLYNALTEKVDEAHLQPNQVYAVTSNVASDSSVSDLEKIVSLYEKGLLTDDEFKTMKEKLMK